MKSLATDPFVLICSGIILLCLFGLFWAIGKFRGLKANGPSDTIRPESKFGRGLDFGTPPIQRMSEPAIATTPVSRDVMERLDGMTQRLAEMQTVLLKQPTGPDTASGSTGQGFSPETIEKLLKIVGNVMQQVDVLQKSMGPKEGPPPAAKI